VSKQNVGSKVTAQFQLSHIDRAPLGNMAETLLVLVACNPDLDFVYNHLRGDSSFHLDTREIRSELGSIPLSHPAGCGVHSRLRGRGVKGRWGLEAIRYCSAWFGGRFAEVLVSRPAACKSCGACQLMDNRPHAVTVRNDAGAKVGDTVALELPGKDLVRASPSRIRSAIGYVSGRAGDGGARGSKPWVGDKSFACSGHWGNPSPCCRLLRNPPLRPFSWTGSLCVCCCSCCVDADNLECASNAAGVTRAHKMREAE